MDLVRVVAEAELEPVGRAALHPVLATAPVARAEQRRQREEADVPDVGEVAASTHTRRRSRAPRGGRRDAKAIGTAIAATATGRPPAAPTLWSPAPGDERRDRPEHEPVDEAAATHEIAEVPARGWSSRRAGRSWTAGPRSSPAGRRSRRGGAPAPRSGLSSPAASPAPSQDRHPGSARSNPRLEAAEPPHERARESPARAIVVSLHVRVVDAARVLDLALDLLRAAPGGARNCSEARSSGKRSLRIAHLRRAHAKARARPPAGRGRPDEAAALSRDSVTARSTALLVLGVGPDGLDEVRNEVVTALELHVDAAPGLVDLVAQRDEPIERERHPEEEHRRPGPRRCTRPSSRYISTRARDLKGAATGRAS